jgi:hypothetical protein
VHQLLQARFERKQFTTAHVGSVALTTAGVLIYLNPIAQGDNISDRQGDTIQAKHLRFHITGFNVTGTEGSTFRLAIFSDSMGSGGILGVTEFLQTANYTSPISAINMQRNRFHVYYDKCFEVVATSAKQEVNVVVDIPLNRKIFFNGATGANADIGKNALYALVIGSNALPDYNHQWGLIYQDN